MKAAVLGTSGYTGLVLLRLLAAHPRITDIVAVSSSNAGVSVDDLDPGLAGDRELARRTGITGGKLATVERAAELEPEVVFAALPHLKSVELCEPFLGNATIIDLSADLRLADPAAFRRAYGVDPPRPDLLEQAVYGLSEWAGPALASADLIANPGCYPTCTTLPLIPLLRDGLVKADFWTNALSGISGAGRSAKINMLYSERTENMNAYNPGTRHRHVEEMLQNLARYGGGRPETDGAGRGATGGGSAATGANAGGGAGRDTAGDEARGATDRTGPDGATSDITLFFIPHLVPVRQGMFVSTRAELADGAGVDDVRRSLERAYENAPFVHITGERIPETRHVRGSNRCDIGWHAEGRQIALFSTIDNLYKGASGQAVQNMNLRFGFDETDGLATGGEF